MAWTSNEIIATTNGGSIHQGGYYSIPLMGFDSVFYCAVECPPPNSEGRLTLEYPQNYWAPNNDSEDLRLKDEMLRAGKAAARVIHLHAKQGRHILVTCHVGKNRSGLAIGLTLRKFGMGGREAVELIKARRPGALSNELFCNLIEGY